ncbi:DUF2232 domain-containing protein [Rhodoplanes sp. Z2-YC6860]|uniref:DUF2232 domain-containing protein n=1 Tax=Rhodoplanes sp. Z2-YC6860 TaxID=674703 RepID=UPI00078BCFA6|nr:DUF2232 domain-containing protein [Rhodoplanes sp. Z2-YC6860]AMN42929.1 hypothetical protein RHPLAN_45000 [Rhodoplanes sp. Z2-YC6860]
MAQIFLIGIGAGAAAALLFASVASGSPLAVVLFYLAPLPILIAALGWSHFAALVAAIAAAASLAAVFNVTLFIAFLIGIGLPAWWLGYLALLARPVENAPDGMEWYPTGHLVVWAAILGAGAVAAGMLYFGTDEPSFRASLRGFLDRMLGAAERMGADAIPLPRESDRVRLLDIMVAVLPPTAAVFTAAVNMFNLWLASRIVRISGRLHRPPSDLSAMRFPPYAPALIGAAFVASFLPGMVGQFGVVVTATMLLAYALLGLAVMHAITRGMNSRPFALGGLYAAVIVFGWPMLLLSALGLADTAFNLRGRVAAKRTNNSNRS